MSNKLNKKGFTLIEVILVLALAGLIMGMAFLAFRQTSVNRRDTQRRADANRLITELQNYYNDKSDWPANSPGGGPHVACADGHTNTFMLFLEEYICESSGTSFMSPSGVNYNVYNYLQFNYSKDSITFLVNSECGASSPGAVSLWMGLEKGGPHCRVIK
jgi:prepilin-type N-terminal cleavage/methylation domain-containing protein